MSSEPIDYTQELPLQKIQSDFAAFSENGCDGISAILILAHDQIVLRPTGGKVFGLAFICFAIAGLYYFCYTVCQWWWPAYRAWCFFGLGLLTIGLYFLTS